MRLVLFVSLLGILGPVAWTSNELKGPKVTLGQGTLVGKTLNSRLGNTFNAFQGIPYAAPPVGKLRFKEQSLNQERMRFWSQIYKDCSTLRKNEL